MTQRRLEDYRAAAQAVLFVHNTTDVNLYVQEKLRLAADLCERMANGELVSRELFEHTAVANERLCAKVAELEQALHMQVCTDSANCEECQ